MLLAQAMESYQTQDYERRSHSIRNQNIVSYKVIHILLYTWQWHQNICGGGAEQPVGSWFGRGSPVARRWRGSRIARRAASSARGSPPDTSGSAPGGCCCS